MQSDDRGQLQHRIMPSAHDASPKPASRSSAPLRGCWAGWSLAVARRAPTRVCLRPAARPAGACGPRPGPPPPCARPHCWLGTSERLKRAGRKPAQSRPSCEARAPSGSAPAAGAAGPAAVLPALAPPPQSPQRPPQAPEAPRCARLQAGKRAATRTASAAVHGATPGAPTAGWGRAPPILLCKTNGGRSAMRRSSPAPTCCFSRAQRRLVIP